MPVKVKKTSGGKYRVSTPGGVKAKGTTKKKAEAQKRLINAVDHGWKPTGKKARKESRERLVQRTARVLLEQVIRHD